ncbi:MAG: hypothetical protein KME12_08945 [Trichocoleus desertorum ATA4-8-CV12]|nr:hypothetical protein [Trichocoleus desertorum ATA4-8-CV12]
MSLIWIVTRNLSPVQVICSKLLDPERSLEYLSSSHSGLTTLISHDDI